MEVSPSVRWPSQLLRNLIQNRLSRSSEWFSWITKVDGRPRKCLTNRSSRRCCMSLSLLPVPISMTQRTCRRSHGIDTCRPIGPVKVGGGRDLCILQRRTRFWIMSMSTRNATCESSRNDISTFPSARDISLSSKNGWRIASEYVSIGFSLISRELKVIFESACARQRGGN
jgi:hypothetical protein